MIPGMNKKQMKQMERQMKKMGMKMEELEGVREVIIRFDDKELIIDNMWSSWNKVCKTERVSVIVTSQIFFDIFFPLFYLVFELENII